MPFLVLLGTGSWRPAPGVIYDPGVHDVDEATAAKAVAMRSKKLLVVAERPILAEGAHPPLTRDDIRMGVRGVQLAETVEPLTAEEIVDVPEVPLDFPCPLGCGAAFPSLPACERHVEMHHASPPTTA